MRIPNDTLALEQQQLKQQLFVISIVWKLYHVSNVAIEKKNAHFHSNVREW